MGWDAICAPKQSICCSGHAVGHRSGFTVRGLGCTRRYRATHTSQRSSTQSSSVAVLVLTWSCSLDGGGRVGMPGVIRSTAMSRSRPPSWTTSIVRFSLAVLVAGLALQWATAAILAALPVLVPVAAVVLIGLG